jgi:hypothetical protein
MKAENTLSTVRFLLLAVSLAGCGAAQDGDQSNAAAEPPAGEQQNAWTVGNWSSTSSSLAAGAFTIGNSSLNLPVCRAAYDGGWQAGKYGRGQCV